MKKRKKIGFSYSFLRYTWTWNTIYPGGAAELMLKLSSAHTQTSSFVSNPIEIKMGKRKKRKGFLVTVSGRRPVSDSWCRRHD